MSESVNHPPHYGGDTTYECIKVLEAWDWMMAYHFCIGNAIKYYSRLGKKTGNFIQDLRKAAWYASKAVELWEQHVGEGGSGGHGHIQWGGGGSGGSGGILGGSDGGGGGWTPPGSTGSHQFPLPHVPAPHATELRTNTPPDVSEPVNEALNRRSA